MSYRRVEEAMVLRMGIFLAAISLTLFLGNVAVAADWPTKIIIKPVEARDPLPVIGNPEIEYSCGWFSECDLVDFMNRNEVCALLVMQNGKTVLHWVAPTRRGCKDAVLDRRYGVASVTKSITSILLGRLIKDREIDTQTSVADALAPIGIDYSRKDVTVRDLLQMSSGMVWSEETEQGVIRIEQDIREPHFTLKEAVQDRLANARFQTDQHGRAPFNYSGFDTQLLGIIAESLLPEGVTLAKYLEVYLWPEIRAGDQAQWKADFRGHPAAYCCLYMAATDLGRLGQWVLDQYRDPKEPMHDWITESVTDARGSTLDCSVRGMKHWFRYGYQWWVLSGDGNGFTGIGKHGQYLHVFPDQQAVVVQLSVMHDDRDRSLCESMLVHRMLAESSGW